jgi:hypothetical protein
MSARSSALELALVLVALSAACGKKQDRKLPEADPERITKLAKRMYTNIPVPSFARDCKYEELMGGATLTKKTLAQLAGMEPEKKPDFADFVNPTELDSPAARQILDNPADEKLRRQGAAELLLAPFFLIYYVDLVDTPLALGIKDFKKGYVGARALRYDKTGKIECTYVFFWNNDPNKQKWAIQQTTRPEVDPAVVKELQVDLRAQMLARVAALAAPPPKVEGPVDDRSERLP